MKHLENVSVTIVTQVPWERELTLGHFGEQCDRYLKHVSKRHNNIARRQPMTSLILPEGDVGMHTQNMAMGRTFSFPFSKIQDYICNWDVPFQMGSHTAS